MAWGLGHELQAAKMRIRNLDAQVRAARLLPVGPERDGRLKPIVGPGRPRSRDAQALEPAPGLAEGKCKPEMKRPPKSTFNLKT